MFKLAIRAIAIGLLVVILSGQLHPVLITNKSPWPIEAQITFTNGRWIKSKKILPNANTDLNTNNFPIHFITVQKFGASSFSGGLYDKKMLSQTNRFDVVAVGMQPDVVPAGTQPTAPAKPAQPAK